MKPHELKKRLEQGEDIELLDIREQDEFDAGNTVEKAQNIPMGKVFVKAMKGELSKDKQIITICKTGGRCEIVARELQDKGYKIEHLEGGLDEYFRQQ